ncbi:MAG TPA: hypothetical protein VGD65_21900 [Chryseosolibacter sp.]
MLAQQQKITSKNQVPRLSFLDFGSWLFWFLVFGLWFLVFGFWSLFFVFCFLVLAFALWLWFLAFGLCFLAFGILEFSSSPYLFNWVIILRSKYSALGDRFAPDKSLLHHMVVRQWGLRYNLNSHVLNFYCG